jgi:hypothetical protein
MDAMSPSSASSRRCPRPEYPGRRRAGLLVAVLAAMIPIGARAFEPERAAFSIEVNGLEIPYRVFGIYVLPGETVELAPMQGRGELSIDVAGSAGPAPTSAGWTWRAPEKPGATTLTVTSASDILTLNVFVLVPSSGVNDQRINGYRVGAYPAEPLNGNSLYLPPDGFIELTDESEDLHVSPHFTLSQFPSKQSGALPKYLVLREQLLLKLELLLEEVNRQGIAADTFTIMSGYRTPFYNAAIKNVPYSRHVFGGAADIYIDVAPRDDIMDDLNRDGRLDHRDAQFLYRIADKLFNEPRNQALIGGMGVYQANAVHGPFLHIDARQQRASWGALP